MILLGFGHISLPGYGGATLICSLFNDGLVIALPLWFLLGDLRRILQTGKHSKIREIYFHVVSVSTWITVAYELIFFVNHGDRDWLWSYPADPLASRL